MRILLSRTYPEKRRRDWENEQFLGSQGRERKGGFRVLPSWSTSEQPLDYLHGSASDAWPGSSPQSREWHGRGGPKACPAEG